MTPPPLSTVLLENSLDKCLDPAKDLQKNNMHGQPADNLGQTSFKSWAHKTSATDAEGPLLKCIGR